LSAYDAEDAEARLQECQEAVSVLDEKWFSLPEALRKEARRFLLSELSEQPATSNETEVDDEK